MLLEDRYLVWQLKRSSEWALCRIYNRYETELLSLATSLLGRKDLAEDVLQDVFLKFIESIDTFELTGSLKSYLAKCIVNRARDYHRRSKRPMDATGAVDYGLEPSPAETVAANEQKQRLAAALAELPDEQREVVLLHLQAGLKFRQIAHIQGTSAKTAWSRYQYGLDRLRSLLDGQVET